MRRFNHKELKEPIEMRGFLYLTKSGSLNMLNLSWRRMPWGKDFMISLIKNRLSLLAVLLLSLQLGLADAPPAGVYTIAFGPETAPVYDLSGPYNLALQIPGAGGQMLDLEFGIGMSQDNKGQLTGSGVTVLLLEGEYLAAAYKVNGKVQRSSGVTRVNFTVKLNGNQAIAGIPTKFSVSTSCQFQIDPVRLVLDGTVKGNANFGQLGSVPINMDLETPLPPGVTGAWKLQATIMPLENFAGAGAAYVANYTAPDNPNGDPPDRTLPGDVKGKYNDAEDSSKLTFKGTGSGTPTNLKLEVRSLPDGGTEVLSMKGTVLGQKVDL
jgi:hypothetical protein